MRSLLLTATTVLVVLFLPANAFTYSSGAPPGHTGSPADTGQRTCATSGCHSGSAVNSGTGSITVSGPTSYQAGETLQLDITVADGAAGRIGFQVSVLDESNNHVGTLQIVDAGVTKYANSNTDFVTHFGAPTSTSSRTFPVGWTAPSTAAGPVTFYIAGNGANANFSSSGDNIYTKTHQLTATATDVATEVLPSHFTVRSAYPNPLVDEATVVVSLPANESVSLRVVDMLGREVVSRFFPSMAAGEHALRVDLAGAPAGTYLAVVESGSGRVASHRLSVVR